MTSTTMTQEEILRLAFRQAVRDWGERKYIADKLPGNEIAASRERLKWKDVQELEKMLKEITKAK